MTRQDSDTPLLYAASPRSSDGDSREALDRTEAPDSFMDGFEHYRPKVGHPAWRVLEREAHELAEELLPQLTRPRGVLRDLPRVSASYATTLRNYRDNRRLVRAGREDLRPLYFIWTLLRTCNFTCEYCDDHTGHKYPDLPNDGVLDTDQAKRLLEIMRTRTSSVYFAGGEPTMRKDLPELTRAARDLNYYPIIINTNGSLLHRWLKRPEWQDWLANMDVIIVSLDALDTDLLGEMWDYRRPIDVPRNILLLRELAEPMRFKLMVNTVIQPGHLAEASDVVDLVNDLGIWFCPVPMNTGPSINAELRDDPEYRALVDKILARKKEGHPTIGSMRMNERFLRSAPLDCRNTLKPHIDFDGSLVWPCKASVNVTPEHLNVLDFDSVDDLYAHACTLIDPTHFHGPATNQCGANCNWAQNYTTDLYAHGLRHPTSLVRDVAGFLKR